MRYLKKLALLVCAIAMALSLAGCEGNQVDDGVYSIGICAYSHDQAYTTIVENLEEKLEAIGEEQGIEFEIEVVYCEARKKKIDDGIKELMKTNPDLLVAVSTPVAKAMKKATEDSKIPVVFAAVSDPKGAGLVDSVEVPGGTFTGTSDYLVADELLELIFAVDKKADKIGIIYDEEQDASIAAVERARKYLNRKGVDCIVKTGSNEKEMKKAAKALTKAKVDAVFSPTDNTILRYESVIGPIFAKKDIPHYAGADSIAYEGAFLGYGADYAKLGKETASIIVSILVDGADPAEISVKQFSSGIASLNKDVCKKVGLKYKKVADRIGPLCTEVKLVTTNTSK